MLCIVQQQMDMIEFEEAVKNSLSTIPARFRRILEKENIELLPREKAPAALQEKFKNKTVFGVFIGVSHNKRSVFSIQSEPTRIELYKESFESVYSTREEMTRQIAYTVIHEVGHYFGFSEEELQRVR